MAMPSRTLGTPPICTPAAWMERRVAGERRTDGEEPLLGPTPTL